MNFDIQSPSINGMVLETRKRREHLSTEDVQKNKALLENFAKGNAQYLEQQQQQQSQNGEIQRKESLGPPPKRNVTWAEYIQSPSGHYPVLGAIIWKDIFSRYFFLHLHFQF